MFDLLTTPVASGWVGRSPGDDYWYTPRVGPATAGMDVDENTALTFATVFACVSKISKTIATLPVYTYTKPQPRVRQPVEHPLNDILNGQASDEALGVTVREAMLANTLLWGRGYAEKVMSNDSRTLKALHNLPTRCVTPKRDGDNKLYYEYRPDGTAKPENLPASRVLAVNGLSLNGITGLSVIGYNREAVALGMASTRFGGSFFGNGAWAGGFITRPLGAPKLGDDAGKRMLAEINDQFRGPSKAFGLGLLREGMEFKQLAMPLKDAQFLELRQYQRVEICGMFDMPPPLIGDLTNAHYNNVEQANIAFAVHCLLPWCIRLESAYRAHCLGIDSGVYVKHNLAGLMRGDSAARSSFYTQGRQWGWLSVDDIREMEDLNPLPDGWGNEYLRPLNMVPVGPAGAILQQQAGEQQEQASTLAIEHGAAKPIAESFRPVLADAARRIVAKECNAAEKAFGRRCKEDRIDGFVDWANKFFTEQEAFAAEAIAPAVEAWQHATGGQPKEQPAKLAADYCHESLADLIGLVSHPQGIPGLIANWRATKAERLTDRLMQALGA